VEGVLFKVLRYQFERKSEIFRDMFSLLQGTQDAEGNKDENPIKLEGVSATEFRHLLKVLYPPPISNDSASFDITDEEWKSILKLATLWRFLEIRKLAIGKLTNCPSMQTVEKILLGRKYFIADWIKSAYSQLVIQTQTPSIADLDRLGCFASVRILCLREE
ncbi:hypothetical protein K435DRAFT_556046, partial [Dendrothele bispora CBS 962.96]